MESVDEFLEVLAMVDNRDLLPDDVRVEIIDALNHYSALGQSCA